MQINNFPGSPAHLRRLRHSRHAAAFLLALAAACLVVVFLGARGASGQSGEMEIDTDPDGNPYVAGELIVTYEEEIPEAPVERVTEEVGSVVEGDLSFVDAQLLALPEVKEEASQEVREETLEETKEELEDDPAVASADYNYLKELEFVPNDRFFGRQWHLPRISAPAAWDTAQGDDATRIAVIDSGLDLDHPDFTETGKIANATNCTVPDESDTADPPANICVDRSVDADGANDTDGHGTHVAGIASAATDNRTGVAGTCPDCSLLIARAESRSGNLTTAAVIAAIGWAINPDNDADVINMSFSGDGQITAERNALNAATAAGVTLVAAAGNQDTRRPRYPAAYPNVISVAATTRQDTRADYSNFGPSVDVSAPGGSSGQNNAVYSTLPGNPGGYGNKIGTSMSSPVVAGLAGLLAGQPEVENAAPAERPAIIRQRIQSTATDLGPRGKDDSFGHGRVNANAAVNEDIGRNTPPTVSNLTPRRGASLGRDRVRIGATVRDPDTRLAKQNIRLFVDGKRRNFKYNANNGRLSQPLRLPKGRHVVRILASDGDASRSVQWVFTTKKSARRAGQGSAGNNGGNSSPNAPGQSTSQNTTINQSG